MKLIVGLGNPGMEYQFTPHNAGFLAIDRIAEQCGVQVANRRGKALTAKAVIAGQEVLLAKPETFMNESGQSVSALLKQLELEAPAEDLIVLYDELAFSLGQMRIAQSGRANGHNGIKSILAALGTEEWMRIRIGVGKPPTDTGRVIKAGGSNYLLAPMRRMQLQELDEVLDKSARAVEMILTQGVAKAMTEFNRRANGDPEAPVA